ncbi:MAG: hypothetical protein LBE74_04945 [Treponema sp.]|jgi:hypothetical protein|nr:hypothetical protein [Treponema sp.]
MHKKSIVFLFLFPVIAPLFAESVSYTPRVAASASGNNIYAVFVYNGVHDGKPGGITLWRKNGAPRVKEFALASCEFYGFFFLENYLFRYNYLSSVLDYYDVEELFKLNPTNNLFEVKDVLSKRKQQFKDVKQVITADGSVYFLTGNIVKRLVDIKDGKTKDIAPPKGKKIDFFAVIEQSAKWEEENKAFSEFLNDVKSAFTAIDALKKNRQIDRQMKDVFGFTLDSNNEDVLDKIKNKAQEVKRKYADYFEETALLGRDIPTIEGSPTTESAVAKLRTAYDSKVKERDAREGEYKTIASEILANYTGELSNLSKTEELKKNQTKRKISALNLFKQKKEEIWRGEVDRIVETKTQGTPYSSIKTLDALTKANGIYGKYSKSTTDYDKLLMDFDFINNVEKDMAKDLNGLYKKNKDNVIIKAGLEKTRDLLLDKKKFTGIYTEIKSKIESNEDLKPYINTNLSFKQDAAETEFYNILTPYLQAEADAILAERAVLRAYAAMFKTELELGKNRPAESSPIIYIAKERFDEITVSMERETPSMDIPLKSQWFDDYLPMYSKFFPFGQVISPVLFKPREKKMISTGDFGFRSDDEFALFRQGDDVYAVKKSWTDDEYDVFNSQSFTRLFSKSAILGTRERWNGILYTTLDAIVCAGEDDIVNIKDGRDVNILSVKAGGNTILSIRKDGDRFNLDSIN